MREEAEEAAREVGKKKISLRVSWLLEKKLRIFSSKKMFSVKSISKKLVPRCRHTGPKRKLDLWKRRLTSSKSSRVSKASILILVFSFFKWPLLF